jgi:hypothetical protein
MLRQGQQAAQQLLNSHPNWATPVHGERQVRTGKVEVRAFAGNFFSPAVHFR